MSESAKGISVACLNNRVYARVTGRGTFQNSQPFRRFAMEKIDEGHEEFIIDLGSCEGTDSTFLGVLAIIGLRLRQSKSKTFVRIIHINQHTVDVLKTLGLDRLFVINGDAPLLPVGADYQQLPDTDITQHNQALDRDGAANLITEAHDSLIRADPRNSPRFKELARLLREANRSLRPPATSR
jgi:anti-anti-sigma regulatory factor